VAVSSIDLKVDCVGACVGVRGSRIKNIVDELGGERIDIVRWNDSLQVLIPNALQPAAIEEVFLYPRLGRAIVLVKEDQLSLAIGRRGQNVRLGSKLVGWDIEIMTHDELTESIERAQNWFLQIPGLTEELVEAFIEEGFLSYDDLTFLEPAQLGELAGITEDQADEIIAFAEEAAEQVEEETRAAKAAGLEVDGRKLKPELTKGPARAEDIFPAEATAPATPVMAAPRQAFENLFADKRIPAEALPQEQGEKEKTEPGMEDTETSSPEEMAPAEDSVSSPPEGSETAPAGEDQPTGEPPLNSTP
jgi:N utilization substance protein A